MRMLIGPTLALGLLLVLTTVSLEPAHACDFPEPPSPREALDEATAVFSGVVTSIKPAEDDPSEQYLAATLNVDRAWKGIDSSQVTVEVHQDQGICGFPFEEGESYLVYAYSNGSPLTTALYHRTVPLEQADEDLEALGPGTEITVQAEAGDQSEEINLGVFVLIIVIVSIVVATVLLLRQSKPGLPPDYDDDADGTNTPGGER